MQEWISSPIGMHPVESGQWVLAADATAERDRLAAENAELKSTDHYQRSLDEMHLRYNVEAELAAANDTLDRLREVLAKWMAFDAFNAYDAIGEIRAILYPPETTSIRDIATAHGFDAMPDDIAQRSVDGETNYVRLNPENET